MTHPGQRYFEQPLPDTNTEKSPPRRQSFHQVFGNPRYRTFQPEGPGRGRRNNRGRGRNDKAFQYSSHRNPNRHHHDRNPREPGYEYPANESQQSWLDQGIRRPGFSPNELHPNMPRHGRDMRESGHGYSTNERHQPLFGPRMKRPVGKPNESHSNMRHHGRDRDLRESEHENLVNEAHQPLLDSGMKRSAFKPIEFDGRKKKRRVAGGRIKKFVRIEEFKGDTYCEICERGFRNVSEKTLHDRSKEHRRNIGYVRTEQMEQEQEDEHVLDIAKTHQVSEDVRQTSILGGTIALLSSKNLPKDFKDWAERSLTAARQAATETNDPSLLQAVQREIIQVHKFNDEHCSLRRVCWTRREAATGSRYRDSSLAFSSLPVIKDPETLAKDTTGPSKKEEPYSGQRKSVLSSEKAPEKTHAEAADVQREEVSMEVVDEAPPTPPPIVDQPPSNEHRETDTIPTRSTPLPTANYPPYTEVKLQWRLSKAAQAMLSCCQTDHKEVVLANYNDKFRNAMMPDEDPANEQGGVNPKNSLITTYREVRKQYEKEEYDYEDLMERMSGLADQLWDDRGRVLQLRDVLQMQTGIALQAGEFRDCRRHCSAFVRTFRPPMSVQGKNINVIGQWFISVLLKGRSAGSRGFPEMLEVAQEMRNFPGGVVEDPWIQESIQAFKHVLGCNWSGFFKRTMENCKKSPLSQMLEGFIPFMREKALVTLIEMTIREEKLSKPKDPLSISRARFQKCLTWNSPEDIEASVEEVKEFVTSLQQPFEMRRNYKDDECIQWRGSCDEEISLSDDIDVRKDMLSKWSKIRALEED